MIFTNTKNIHEVRYAISGKLFCAAQLILMISQLLLFIMSGAVENICILFRMTPCLDKIFKYIL